MANLGISEIGSPQLPIQQNNSTEIQVADASTNTAAEILGTEPETNDRAADQVLRPRIDSLNTHDQQFKARSPSFVSENHDGRSRIASVGTGAARRPSFIKGEGKELDSQQAAYVKPARSPRRQKAVSKPLDQDSGATSAADTVPETLNKTSTDPHHINQTKCLRQDSSSSAESVCQSGESMSSYDADPEFPLSQTEVADNNNY